MGAGDFKLGLAERLHAALSYLREAGELLSREFLRNRRHARRHEARLPVSFSVLDKRDGQRAQTAYTCDLSAAGLSLLLPFTLITGVALDLTLQLPRAPVRAAATVVRCAPLAAGDAKAGYLVALVFSRIGDEDLERLRRHLRRARPF